MTAARIDLHTHLAGLGSQASGCRVSARMRWTLTYHAMLWSSGARSAGARGREDEAYAQRLIQLIETSSELDYACAFALDGAYDAHGELDVRHSHLVVPNAHVMAVCARSPRLLPVISINPEAKGAIAELERWGPRAVALKWLAPLQRFALDARRHERFIALLRELELVVIAHTGCEHTFPGMRQHLGNPALYEPLLEAGIPVVFSHCGTGSWLHPGYDYSREFARLLERYEHAYGDSSAFATLVRGGQIPRIRHERYASRILHGSDYPIPSMAFVFWRQLGLGEVWRLQRHPNPLDRDVIIKRKLGMPDESFTSASRLLAGGIARWQRFAGFGPQGRPE